MQSYLCAEAAFYAVGIYTEAAFHTEAAFTKQLFHWCRSQATDVHWLLSVFLTKMWANIKNENVNHVSNNCIKVSSQTFPNEDKLPMFHFYFYCFASHFCCVDTFSFCTSSHSPCIHFLLSELWSDYSNLINVIVYSFINLTGKFRVDIAPRV